MVENRSTLKVYLDTSVISYLLQEDAPEKMADTLKLWDMFKSGKYDVYLSTVTLEEVNDCHEPKRSEMLRFLEQIEYTPIVITSEMSDVAQQIIDMKILTQKSYDDCQHIAAAVIYGCDCIISWNFKHIVNIKTIRGVRAITNLKGYKPLEILNPSVLLESEEE
jgi:predicted nucleic acid-binding protein